MQNGRSGMLSPKANAEAVKNELDFAKKFNERRKLNKRQTRQKSLIKSVSNTSLQSQWEAKRNHIKDRRQNGVQLKKCHLMNTMQSSRKTFRAGVSTSPVKDEESTNTSHCTFESPRSNFRQTQMVSSNYELST